MSLFNRPRNPKRAYDAKAIAEKAAEIAKQNRAEAAKSEEEILASVKAQQEMFGKMIETEDDRSDAKKQLDQQREDAYNQKLEKIRERQAQAENPAVLHPVYQKF
jgi:hypothetical protein